MTTMNKRRNAYPIIGLVIILAFLMLAGSALAQTSDLRVSLISQNPDPVGPGETLELRWQVENYGTKTAENVIFEILPSYPFSLEPGVSAVQNIGSIVALQTGADAVTVFYRLQVDPGALPGDDEINLRYSPDGGSTWVILDPFDLRIASHTATLSVESVSVTPERLIPGETATIIMRLKNNADGVLKDIKVKLNFISIVEGGTTLQYTELPFAPVGSSNEMAIALLAPGKTVDVTFNIIVSGDANSEVYKIPLSLNYVDKDENEYSSDETTTFLGLVVDSEPEYELALKDTEIYTAGSILRYILPTAGSTGDVVISLSNIGSSEIKYLSMELLDGEHYQVISPPVTYVGNLESDDFETAEFTINIGRKAKDAVPLAVRLTYKDNYNKAFEKTETVSLPVYSKLKAHILGLVPWALLGQIKSLFTFVVLGGAGYWYFKVYKRKKK